MKPRTYEIIFWLSALAGAATMALAGCSLQEVKESGGNALGAVGDTVGAIAADPSNAFTPQGLAVLAATFVTGFFSRQSASLAKWAASGTGGWLVRTFGSFFKR
jgi:hypothetical protein